MNPLFLETARLLTQVAPLVFVDDTFALKGGTAINLFVRDMPRLSVTFPDHTLPRDQALPRINDAIRQAAERLNARGFQTHVPAADAGETKLLVRRGPIEVKIEANFVWRGTVQPVRKASLVPAARDALMADLDVPMMSLADLYGSKLVAALDRQHPRDLFDVMQLFEHEGITPDIRRAFVVYLAALLAARERMVDELQQCLDNNERRFLLSLVAGTPDWPLLGIAHLEHLPGIRWKLHNLAQLQRVNAKKFAEQADVLAILLANTASGAVAPSVSRSK
jgi:predicted nucleotidyltransferase component of viral defense system